MTSRPLMDGASDSKSESISGTDSPKTTYAKKSMIGSDGRTLVGQAHRPALILSDFASELYITTADVPSAVPQRGGELSALVKLPSNFKCADVICDFCGYLAQVKAARVRNIDRIPDAILFLRG
jgi:hypothetical protein